MARIRTIKPELAQSLDVASWSLLAQALWPRLFCHVDDDGRCIYDPRLLAAALAPLMDDCTASAMADVVKEWESTGSVVTYDVEGRTYLAVANFGDHQRINRKTDSDLPPPPSDPSSHTHEQLSEDVHREVEGKGREGNRDQDLGSGAAVTTVDIEGCERPFPVKSKDMLTPRIIAWAEAEGLEESKGWRDPPQSADVALRAVADVLGESTDATKASQQVCVELIRAVTGEDVPQPTWGHLGRLVTTQDKRELAGALVVALEAGAGLTGGYVDDPLALTKYAKAVLNGSRSAA